MQKIHGYTVKYRTDSIHLIINIDGHACPEDRFDQSITNEAFWDEIKGENMKNRCFASEAEESTNCPTDGKNV